MGVPEEEKRVVRVWEGCTATENEAEYTRLIVERDLPNYKKINGFMDYTFLKYEAQGTTYFKLLTFWKDFEAIKDFAGPDFNNAVGYEGDKRFLLDFPGKVFHYERFGQ